MDFGQRLKELRVGSNTSQKELSEKTGLSLRTIQRIENNEVKPSIHSLKTLGDYFKVDLSDFGNKTETQPYEFNLSIKITDMNQFLTDLKTLFRNNWKILLVVGLLLFFMLNYPEIKAGLIDGFNNK